MKKSSWLSVRQFHTPLDTRGHYYIYICTYDRLCIKYLKGMNSIKNTTFEINQSDGYLRDIFRLSEQITPLFNGSRVNKFTDISRKNEN